MDEIVILVCAGDKPLILREYLRIRREGLTGHLLLDEEKLISERGFVQEVHARGEALLSDKGLVELAGVEAEVRDNDVSLMSGYQKIADDKGVEVREDCPIEFRNQDAVEGEIGVMARIAEEAL